MLRYLWNNSLIFLFLGVVFGIVIACGFMFGGKPAAVELATEVGLAASNGYVLTFISTFMAAVTATGVVFFIEWLRSQKMLLAEINAAKAICYGYIESLILVRHDQFLPELKRITHYREIFFLIGLRFHVEFNKSSYEPLENSASIPYDKIARYAAKDVDALRFLIKSQEAVSTVVSYAKRRNALLDEISKVADDKARLVKHLGLLNSVNNREEMDFYNLTCGTVSVTDYAVFFLQESLNHLDQLAEKALCSKLRSGLVRLEPINDQRMRDCMRAVDGIRDNYYSTTA